MSRRSRYYFDPFEDMKHKITMSQKLSARKREFKDYTGGNIELARQIAILKVCKEHHLLDDMDEELYNLAIDILIESNKALFSSSEKTSEVTKLGFWLPEKEKKGVDASK